MRTFPVCILVALAALGCGLCAAEDEKVQCPGLDSDSFCDCGDDCGGSFCQCADAVACCSGEEEEANAGNVTVTMAINAPLSEVSPYLITFDMAKLTALPQIAPLLTLVETTGATVGSTRLINGAGPLVGVTVKEELVAFTSNTVTYKILEASGPTSIVNASNYVATVTATASADGTTTTIDWESTFDAAADVDMDGLKADLAGFYALFISAVAAKLELAALVAAAKADGVDAIFGMESIDRLVTVHYAAAAFNNTHCLKNSTQSTAFSNSTEGAVSARREYAATNWTLDPTMPNMGKPTAARITTDDTRGYPTITWPCTAGETFTMMFVDLGNAAAISSQNSTGQGYVGVAHGIVPNITCNAASSVATTGNLQEGAAAAKGEYIPALSSTNASLTANADGKYKYFELGNPFVEVGYYNYFIFLQPPAPTATPAVWEWDEFFLGEFHPNLLANKYKLGAPVAHTWVTPSVGVTSVHVLNALGYPSYGDFACDNLKGVKPETNDVDAYGSGSGSGDDYDCPELGEIWDGANCTFEVFCNLTTHFQMYGNVEQDRVCVLLEACTFETQFASKEPTRITPRECSPVTQCDNKTQFESKAPTETSDRVCADAKKCDTKTQWVSVKMGKFNDAECSQVSPACNQAYGYELVPATETQDRECKAWKQCNSLYADSPQYMMRDGIVTDNVADFRDRACKSVTTCKLNQYELNRPTNQTDRKCKDRTVCDKKTTYISRDATSFSDTVCTLMDELPEVTELVLTLQMEITLNPRAIPPGKEDAVALEIVEGLTKYLVEETGLDKTIIKKMWLFFLGKKSQNPFPGDLFAEVIGIQKKPKVKKNKKNKKAGRPSSGPAGSAGPAAGPGPGRRATGDGWTIEVGMVDSDSSTVQKLAIAQTALDEAIQGKTGPAFALKTIEGVSVSIDATAVTERCTANCASLGRSTNAGNSTGTGTAPLGPYDKFVIPLVVCIILVFVIVLIVVYFKQNKEDNKVLPTHATGGEARGAETPDGPTPDGPTPALESDEADNKAHTAAQMMDKAAPIKVAHERVGSIAALGVSSRGMCSICGKEVLISDHRDKNADGTYRHQACGKKSTESPV